MRHPVRAIEGAGGLVALPDEHVDAAVVRARAPHLRRQLVGLFLQTGREQRLVQVAARVRGGVALGGHRLAQGAQPALRLPCRAQVVRGGHQEVGWRHVLVVGVALLRPGAQLLGGGQVLPSRARARLELEDVLVVQGSSHPRRLPRRAAPPRSRCPSARRPPAFCPPSRPRLPSAHPPLDRGASGTSGQGGHGARAPRSGAASPARGPRRSHPGSSSSSTSGSSPKRAFASVVTTVRRPARAVAAMIRSWLPRGSPSLRTCASRSAWARAARRS